MVNQDFRPSGGQPGEAAGNAGGGASRSGGDPAPQPPPSQAREREAEGAAAGAVPAPPAIDFPAEGSIPGMMARARAGCVRRGNSLGTESRENVCPAHFITRGRKKATTVRKILSL